jgi:Uma2 family endonuclease
MDEPQSSSPSTPWDYEAYASIPYDGKRHEILEGRHYVSPVPSLYHQAISRHIQFQLYTQIELPELGVVISAPVDVQLGQWNIVQPDLVIITRKRRHIMTPTKVKGIPELLVEILSPSNPGHDLDKKRRVYEQMGVPEYWIVFPEEHQVLQLVIRDGKYTENTVTDAIKMTDEPFATVDLTKVW